jgi:peptidoglycan/LPS O-acetylase OafA/YrhL
MAMFPPDWSVSTEWFFYFAFVPLVFLVMWLRRPCAAMMGWCVFGALLLAGGFICLKRR